MPYDTTHLPHTAAALMRRTGFATLIGLALVMLVVGPASAHGITSDAATASAPGFIIIGAEHMLLGWDHILFVAGVVLLAGNLRRGAKTISVFVLGHSLTLLTATLAGWEVNATLVDVIIIASVAVVGLFGMFGGVKQWDIFTAIVFGFGLVHGLGLATRFQALGVADDGRVWRLIAFNVGIEIGQVTVIVGLLGIGAVASMLFGGKRDIALTKVAFVGLFALGAMVAPLFAFNNLSGPDADVDVALPPGAPCTVSDRSETFPAAGGGHTEKQFYEPGEAVPMENFGHSLADGYVVVLYPEDMASEDLTALRDFVTMTEANPVLAGARDTNTTTVDVITSTQQTTCERLHVGALRQFSSTWLEALGYEA